MQTYDKAVDVQEEELVHFLDFQMQLFITPLHGYDVTLKIVYNPLKFCNNCEQRCFQADLFSSDFCFPQQKFTVLS